jgi:hypothetical protein
MSILQVSAVCYGNPSWPRHPVIPLLGIYPRGLKTSVRIITWKWIFKEELFLRVKKWKPPKCSFTDEWGKQFKASWQQKEMKYWYKPQHEEPWKYYAKWKKVDTNGRRTCNSTHRIFQIKQIHRNRERISGCLGWGEVGMWSNRRVSLWGDENVLELESGDG